MKEATQILNVSSSMVRKYVEKGKIHYFLPEGREHGFYLKKDVDKLGNALNAFLNMEEDTETTFAVASKDDLIEIQKIGLMLFTPGSNVNPTPPEWRMKVVEKNPDIMFVLKKDEQVIGYVSTLPFKAGSNKIARVLEVDFLRDANITPDDIESFDMGKHIILYIAAIGLDPKLSSHDRKRQGAKLIRDFITEVVKIGEKGVIIDKIIARGETHSGIKLLQAFGFSEIIPPAPGKRAFVINMEESGAPVSLQYKQALRESDLLNESSKEGDMR